MLRSQRLRTRLKAPIRPPRMLIARLKLRRRLLLIAKPQLRLQQVVRLKMKALRLLKVTSL